MNRIVRLAYTKALQWPKPSTGIAVLQKGNAHTPSTLQYLSRRNPVNVQNRKCSSFSKKDERTIEEDAEIKIGWLLKLIFAGSACVLGYNLFPYMGENIVEQSVQLLRAKDHLLKRMGASRLARLAINDDRRMRIVELGGAHELVNMLVIAKDDRTRKQALKALVAIAKSDKVVGALHKTGAIPVIVSTPESAECPEIEEYKLNLLSRFRYLKYDI